MGKIMQINPGSDWCSVAAPLQHNRWFITVLPWSLANSSITHRWRCRWSWRSRTEASDSTQKTSGSPSMKEHLGMYINRENQSIQSVIFLMLHWTRCHLFCNRWSITEESGFFYFFIFFHMLSSHPRHCWTSVTCWEITSITSTPVAFLIQGRRSSRCDAVGWFSDANAN